MGYFSNGFVFTSEPNFKAVPSAIPGRNVRGFKHNQSDLWLVDIWKPRGKLRSYYPFSQPSGLGFRTDVAPSDASTRELLTKLAALYSALEFGTPGAEINYIHLALAVATAAATPCYFWAADDDETDLAGCVSADAVRTFGCRLDRFRVIVEKGTVTIVPEHCAEDGDDEAFAEAVGMLKKVPGVTVTEPFEVEGGRILYENPVQQWPVQAGDPAEVLGFGSWDPVINVERDFSVVFDYSTQ